jgi:hypothetical protein
VAGFIALLALLLFPGPKSYPYTFKHHGCRHESHFPTYSRLQDDSKILKSSIEKLFLYCAFGLSILAGVSITLLISCILSPNIPNGFRLSYALLTCANAAIASITTPLTNAFNAVGKIHITTKL